MGKGKQYLICELCGQSIQFAPGVLKSLHLEPGELGLLLKLQKAKGKTVAYGDMRLNKRTVSTYASRLRRAFVESGSNLAIINEKGVGLALRELKPLGDDE